MIGVRRGLASPIIGSPIIGSPSSLSPPALFAAAGQLFASPASFCFCRHQNFVVDKFADTASSLTFALPALCRLHLFVATSSTLWVCHAATASDVTAASGTAFVDLSATGRMGGVVSRLERAPPLRPWCAHTALERESQSSVRALACCDSSIYSACAESCLRVPSGQLCNRVCFRKFKTLSNAAASG